MNQRHYDLGKDFDEVFSPEYLSPLLTAIQTAYDNACETMSPEYGDDKFTFGNKVWRFVCHETKRATRTYDYPIFKAVEPNNRLRIVSAIGGYTIGINKIGHTGKENIHESFPNNMSNVVQMAQNQPQQLSLFAEENVEVETTALRNVIIGHMGNADDGLCSVYLCMPIMDEQNNVVKWAYAKKIWDKDEDYVAPESSNSSYDLAPEETVSKPVLTLKDDARVEVNE